MIMASKRDYAYNIYFIIIKKNQKHGGFKSNRRTISQLDS